MFGSRTPFCFRKCPAFQYRANSIPKIWLFAEATQLQCYQLLPGEPKAGIAAGGIHTCSVQQGKNLFKKFDMKTKKKLWYKSSFVPKQVAPSTHIDGLNLTTQRKRNDGESARIKILNNLLFKAISDLLSTPEVSPEIYHLGFEISKVSLAGDYSSCRIYWRTSGTHEKDSQIQQALDRYAPRIRYLLISHQVMGSVPPVLFIKDKVYAAISEVENLLKVADFGEKFAEEEKFEPSLKDGESDQRGKLGISKQTNLFGIDHEALMKQILEHKQKRRDLQNDDCTVVSMQQHLELLQDLRKQKIIDKKTRKLKHLIDDDDITPEDYLLARYGQEEEREDQDDEEYGDGTTQVKGFMEKEEKSSKPWT